MMLEQARSGTFARKSLTVTGSRHYETNRSQNGYFQDVIQRPTTASFTVFSLQIFHCDQIVHLTKFVCL